MNDVLKDVTVVKSVVKMPIRAKPYEHQIKGFNKCMENNGYGLLYDVGLGKSLTAVAVMGARHLHNGITRVLVVCPLAVVPVWERECENLTINYNAIALYGTSKQKIDTLRHIPNKGLQIVIVNYDSARNLVDELIKFDPQMLVVDESQRIKNPQSKQTKAVHKIAYGCKYRIILTATPVGNSVADVFSQWKVIDDNIFGRSFYSFKAKYLVLGGYLGKQIVGTMHMDELTEKMHSIAMRVTKEEALDMPKQIFETRYCELEPRAKAIYKGLVSDCYSELNGGEITATNILTKLLRLQQCADDYLKADSAENYEMVSTSKLDLLTDTLEEVLGGNEKIVIFARFTAEIEGIKRTLRKLGINHLTLDGAVKNKGEVVEEFQSNDDVKVIVCQTQVGGVGITLTSASVMIFYSHSFSLIDYLQAIGRIHRINQKHRCLYIDLIASGTVDEHIQNAIKQKRNLSDNVVDHWRDLLGGG